MLDDGVCGVSWLFVGIVGSVEYDRLEGDVMALGDSDLFVEWVDGGTSVERIRWATLHW